MLSIPDLQHFLSRWLTKGNVVEKTGEGPSIENFSVGSWEDWPLLWLVASSHAPFYNQGQDVCVACSFLGG